MSNMRSTSSQNAKLHIVEDQGAAAFFEIHYAARCADDDMGGDPFA